MQESNRINDIVAMRDTTLTVAEPDSDVRGRTVIDADGEEIGRVDDLLVDADEAKVRLLRVGAGGFLGIGERHFLVPVEAITRVDDDRVCISRDRDRLGDVPTYDPALAERPDYYANVYGWWGVPPYWAGAHPGFAFPVRPVADEDPPESSPDAPNT